MQCTAPSRGHAPPAVPPPARYMAGPRTGPTQLTAAFLRRVQGGGVSENELSALLSRDLLIPVAHGVTYDEIRSISPLLGSRNGLSTGEDRLERRRNHEHHPPSTTTTHD